MSSAAGTGIPSAAPDHLRAAVAVLDDVFPSPLAESTKFQRKKVVPASGVSEVRVVVGEPSRDRTEDPLIKSQVLCQLS